MRKRCAHAGARRRGALAGLPGRRRLPPGPLPRRRPRGSTVRPWRWLGLPCLQDCPGGQGASRVLSAEPPGVLLPAAYREALLAGAHTAWRAVALLSCVMECAAWNASAVAPLVFEAEPSVLLLFVADRHALLGRALCCKLVSPFGRCMVCFAMSHGDYVLVRARAAAGWQLCASSSSPRDAQAAQQRGTGCCA